MARRLNNRDKNFAADFEALLFAKREIEEDVALAVRGLIADVRARGDAALVELTNKFDRASITAADLKVSAAEIETALTKVTAEQKEAIEIAATRIEAYHRRQLPKDESFKDDTGAVLGWRWTAVDSAGLYVPGGTASYPSSVLMNAIPAKVAGVARIVMVTPAGGGHINPLVLAAARRAGVSDIFRIGGAQAVAALAYGTESIAAVDKIVGPGNAWVAAAKREVFGQVGIDSIAGPSEILVIADAANDPDWIAADLLAQAEHDASSQSILITDDAGFADKVADAAERALALLAAQGYRRAKLERLWRHHRGGKIGRCAGAGRPLRARASGDRHRRSERLCWPRCAMRAPSSWAVTRPKRWAIISPVPTMCCRPRVRRASPRGFRCWTS